MPELPEVETIRQRLRNGTAEHPSILRMTVRSGLLMWNRTLVEPDQDAFENEIAGQTITEIGRRGKYLIFQMDRSSLLIHLRMSGDIIVESDSEPTGPYHRVVLEFENRTRMAFTDPRKFGRAWFVPDPERIFAKLGPEPLDSEFTEEHFFHSLTTRKRLMKPLLLDQSVIAGLGNIYVDEALFLARIHPLQLSNRVDEDFSRRLYDAIRCVLQEGLYRNGASIDWVYRGGDFQNYFKVYRRTGEPCSICGTPIQRIIVSQRSTHLCPNCQRI